MKAKNQNSINWDLLAKKMAGELNSEEEEMMNQWRSQNSENEKDFNEVKKLWGETKYARELDAVNTDGAWNKVQQKMRRKPANLYRQRMLWSVAASVAVIMGLLIGDWIWKGKDKFIEQTVVIAENNMQQITLADGTDVSINGGTTFMYPQQFEGQTRTVKLDGEAFFKVTRDKDVPFVIETNDLVVKVLGTSFNVKSYKGMNVAEVIVESGSVEVSLEGNRENRVVLSAGEKALFNRETQSLISMMNEDENYNAWSTRIIQFKDAPMTEVVKVLEDVYKIEISVSDSMILEENVLTATFNQYALEHVLEIVCSTFNLEYAQQGKTSYVITYMN
ncbi:FecR family protein [Marinilabiliaceae bacterium JC017]|nr:FecR family protein [Marinilabiliaceae bacterium JC017]